MKSLGSFALGLVTGAVMGVGAGLLFAPREGKHTRSKLSYQLSRLREQLQAQIQERFAPKSNEDILFNDAKNEGEAVTKTTQKRAKQLNEDLDKLLNEQMSKPSVSKTKKK
jgi:gas vesicle protein